MTKFISIMIIGACLWATVDIMQSKQTGFKKALWIASFWLFSLIALPLYFFIGRKSNQSNPKFGGAAWGSIIGLMFAGPLGAIAGAYLGHSFEAGKEKMNARSGFQISLFSILSNLSSISLFLAFAMFTSSKALYFAADILLNRYCAFFLAFSPRS